MEAVRATKVNGNKEQAHDDRDNGEEFSEYHKVVEIFILVDVYRDNEHYGGCGDSDEIGEVGDVETPGDLVGHACGCEPLDELLGVCVKPKESDDRKDEHPKEVLPVADKAQAEATEEEPCVALDESLGLVRWSREVVHASPPFVDAVGFFSLIGSRSSK